MSGNDALQDAVSEFTAALRQVGNRVWQASISLAIASYDAFTQFCRWLGCLVAKLYFSAAEILADIIYAAKVFYAPLASIIVYYCFHITIAIYAAVAYLGFIAIAIVLFYKRSDKIEKIQRPFWATVSGHIFLVTILLSSILLTVSQLVPLVTLQLLIRRSNAGDQVAMFELGTAYHDGEFGLKKDNSQALAWFENAAALGNRTAMFNVGAIYMEGKDPEKALEWYGKAALLGDSTAMFNVGVGYMEGIGGLHKDPEKALEWYQRAAALGEPNAMNEVGVDYMDGTGGPHKDPEKAVEWYQKAAALGNPTAMYNLSGCYEQGVGVQSDKNKATDWLQKAANLGYEPARKELQSQSRTENSSP